MYIEGYVIILLNNLYEYAILTTFNILEFIVYIIIEHNVDKMNPFGTKHTCSICQKEFAFKSGLYRHNGIKHKNNKLQCLICNTTFTRKETLKVHLKKDCCDRL